VVDDKFLEGVAHPWENFERGLEDLVAQGHDLRDLAGGDRTVG